MSSGVFGSGRSGQRFAAHLLAATVVIASAPRSARSWEITTHAGLAEQAGIASKLHARLIAMGFERGLFEPLTVPPADAGPLIESLRRMSPSHGFVPDRRGRQYALAWLSAGAALADTPLVFSYNHYLDARSGEGFRRPALALGERVSALANQTHRGIPDRGVAAPQWVIDPNNPLGMAGFVDQYTKAVRATTEGERSRHMAGALIAAGAMLHVLGDVGVPSRARGDFAAGFADLGDQGRDRGERIARVASLAYGRVGVPAPSRPVTRRRLRDFFLAPASGALGPGLADSTAATWFSPYTLPAPTQIDARGNVAPKAERLAPALPKRLAMMAASQPGGTTMRDRRGVCLARYGVEDDTLSFWFDDDCLLEQLAHILPEVAAYETGLLDFLFRGELKISQPGAQSASQPGAPVTSAIALGAGELEFLSEDASGRRTSLSRVPVKAAAAGAELATMPQVPSGSVRMIALFRGVDASGELVIATGFSRQR